MDSGNMFSLHTFNAKVRSAKEHVRKILEKDRVVTVMADAPHTYHDKFAIVEFCTTMAHRCHQDVFQALGLDMGAGLKKLNDWHEAGLSVTLRLASKQSNQFLRESEHEVESAKVKEVQKSGIFKKTTETSVVNKVKDYFYKTTYEWEIFLFAGTNTEDKIVLRTRKGSLEYRQRTKITKLSTKIKNPDVDVALDGFIGLMPFKIDRSSKFCRTPRRNPEVEKALAYFKALSLWCKRTKDYLSRNFRFEENARPDGIGGVFEKRPVNSLNASAIFCPVTPLIENRKALLLTDGEDGDTSVILSQDDFDSFLKEHRRTLDAQLSKVKDTFPASDTARLITQAEASTMIIVMQIQALIDGYCNAVGYVEHMLYTQLEQAVGKKITSKDFNAYMLYHNKRLFLDDYVPKPFCYSIRRPDHFPEGLVTLEQSDPDASGGFAALPTITSRENNADNTAKMACMSFALNAATTVRFSGPRYVHAAILQQFTSVASLPTLRLCARARQFSSFILMLGTLAPGNEFEPKHALIIKDKDDLQVPLLLETIPTPAEFRDAIESLSPEQQRFAKAYRGMQLAGTLFTVVVVQIKPQLEKLLGLPDDSLTKEIKLTQALMDLFIKYQIPSDLISFDPAKYSQSETVSVQQKLKDVKSHVKQLEDMLTGMEDKTLVKSAKAYTEDLLNSNINSRSAPLKKKKYKKRNMAKRGMVAKRSMAVDNFLYESSAVRPSMCAPPVPPSSSLQPRSAPAPAPTSQAKTPVQTQESKNVVKGTPVLDTEDLTNIPNELDAKYLALDTDGTLRPTTIKVHPDRNWKKEFQRNLLSKPESTSMNTSTLQTEKNAAFDLLDALSRSGSLSIDCAEVHVVVAATHRFTRTVVDTVIMDNVNPIEKIERSVLIVGTTIHRKPCASNLLRDEHVARISEHSPHIFLDKEETKNDA